MLPEAEQAPRGRPFVSSIELEDMFFARRATEAPQSTFPRTRLLRVQ